MKKFLGIFLSLFAVVAIGAAPTAFTPTYVTPTGTQTLTNKTLVAPVLGAATATTVNKVTITAPATAATLTIIDGTTVTGPAATGTLATLAGTEALTGKTNIGTTTISTPTNLLVSSTAPTISSGFGTSPSVTAHNGTAAFRINVGTGGSATSGVIGLPAAATGWNCFAHALSTINGSTFVQRQTASSTTSATIGNYTDTGASGAWPSAEVLAVSCFAY